MTTNHCNKWIYTNCAINASQFTVMLKAYSRSTNDWRNSGGTLRQKEKKETIEAKETKETKEMKEKNEKNVYF